MLVRSEDFGDVLTTALGIPLDNLVELTVKLRVGNPAKIEAKFYMEDGDGLDELATVLKQYNLVKAPDANDPQ
jgi:hypothetical protein